MIHSKEYNENITKMLFQECSVGKTTIHSKEYLENRIKIFLEKNPHSREALETIIKKMMDDCRYQNGESLEKHNWNNEPKKLKNIPKNKEDIDFEKKLLEALRQNDFDGIAKYISEICWGDVQSGKTIHACIIMWVSVFILKRPVLYIFRNIGIDKDNLQDDIRLEKEYSFNVKYIKNFFDKMNKEFIAKYGTEEYKDYKLPDLIDINSNGVIDKLSHKNNMKSTDIYCCLANEAQLERIDKEFSKYISNCDELVNITLLVDEADLMTPTARNDRIATKKNETNTACERLLSTIYQKVTYSLKITGTAHSLLSNYTTKLSDNEFVEIKPSQVHVMKTHPDYYGIMNHKIDIKTKTEEEIPENELNEQQLKKKTENGTKYYRPIVTEFWEKEKYSPSKNYIMNIKPILSKIISRDLSASPTLYSHALISEDKFKENQFRLVDKIIKDFEKIFVILFHGDCLRLYLSKEYQGEILHLSQKEGRLFYVKGIHGSSIDNENDENLQNNYCYFDINVKKNKKIKLFTIKQVYKLLSMLFVDSRIPIECKTVVTISGKYADRGYSFTSDDYGKYIFHLTDQIYFSHSSIIFIILAQCLRLQVKTTDINLKNGLSQLTLWTTKECEEAIEFYVKFSTLLKNEIEGLNTEEIIQLLEKYIYSNLDNNFKKYVGVLDNKNKMKNTIVKSLYEKKHNAIGLRYNVKDEPEDNRKKWIKEQNDKRDEGTKFPEYKECVNKIETCSTKEFIKKHGVLTRFQKDEKIREFKTYDELISQITKLDFPEQISNPTEKWFQTRIDRKVSGKWIDRMTNVEWEKQSIDDYRTDKSRNMGNKTETRLWNLAYDTDDELYISLRYTDENAKNDENENIGKELPRQTICIKETPYIFNGNDTVYYSVLNDKYKDASSGNYYLPDKYYYETPVGWLYLRDPDLNSHSSQIKVIQCHKDTSSLVTITDENIIIEPIINNEVHNSDVQLFINNCCHNPIPSNLRMGINEIYVIYKEWCLKHSKNFLKKPEFKCDIEKAGINNDECKGVDINNKPGKRGYNIMVKI